MPPASPPAAAAAACYTIVVEPHGWRFLADASQAIADAADRAHIHLPRSCRNGTCRVCLCRLVCGRVRYDIDWPGLSAEEKAEGCILPCVARAESDLVIAVPDATRRAAFAM